ncbi:MAG: VWA domain-containing protein [Blastocatellia bacterium]
MALTLRLAALMLLVCLTPAVVLSQNQGVDDNAIKLSARWVNLNVSVTDRQGKKVTQLKREDFVILEDGVPQEIVHFAPVDAPVNLVLLLDLSGSIGGKLKAMKKAATRFVESLKDDDRMAVAVFTSRFKLVSGFTSDHKRLKNCIDDIKHPGGGTRLYDAEWKTYDLLGEIKDGRKAIVVLTDGVDSALLPKEEEDGSAHTFYELLTRAVEEDTTIYPIYFDTEPDMEHRYSKTIFAEARTQLRTLADQTGGAYFMARRIEDLDGVYQLVAAELHSLYSVAYAATDARKDGHWRVIKLKVKLDGINTKTKRGYFAK